MSIQDFHNPSWRTPGRFGLHFLGRRSLTREVKNNPTGIDKWGSVSRTSVSRQLLLGCSELPGLCCNLSRTTSHVSILSSSLSEAFPQIPLGFFYQARHNPSRELRPPRGDSKQRGARWWSPSQAAARRVDWVLAARQIVTFALVIRRTSFLGFYD